MKSGKRELFVSKHAGRQTVLNSDGQSPEVNLGIDNDEAFFCQHVALRGLPLDLSGTESAILNRESGDSESCDSNCAIPGSRQLEGRKNVASDMGFAL